MADELVFKAVIDGANAAKTLGEVKQSVKEINEELGKVPIGSKAFGDLTVALGKSRGHLQDLKEQVKALGVGATAYLTELLAGQQITGRPQYGREQGQRRARLHVEYLRGQSAQIRRDGACGGAAVGEAGDATEGVVGSR